MAIKPSLARGTRDFGPDKMIRRNFIFSTIKEVFQKFGFLPLETPAIENLSVLSGKYGDEGDKLIFKILNSGDFLSEVNPAEIKDFKSLTPKISEKALRYDLTVPFARYVVMNRNDLAFPFKRYQIQPVWRADRPAKGRYREFYQCDADVVGTASLVCEAEIVLMINEVLRKLGLKDFTIKINNRKILTGITEIIGKKGSETQLCVAIDKLDKIGLEGVIKELKENDFSEDHIQKLLPIINLSGNTREKLNALKNLYASNTTLSLGVGEFEQILKYLEGFGADTSNLEFDITLARGLSYYTGAIFEVKTNETEMGSICGGGRYDNLTGVFGLPDTSGVGISFGVDRIYDVLETLGRFPSSNLNSTRVLVCGFDEECLQYGLSILSALRNESINAEIYPEAAKMKKQMSYADSKKIPYVIIIGGDELKAGNLTLKDMLKGEQVRLSLHEAIARIKNQ
ncbi:MAG: histidine--tRNA ligase [Cytophagaceae bacterium]